MGMAKRDSLHWRAKGLSLCHHHLVLLSELWSKHNYYCPSIASRRRHHMDCSLSFAPSASLSLQLSSLDISTTKREVWQRKNFHFTCRLTCWYTLLLVAPAAAAGGRVDKVQCFHIVALYTLFFYRLQCDLLTTYSLHNNQVQTQVDGHKVTQLQLCVTFVIELNTWITVEHAANYKNRLNPSVGHSKAT